MSAVCHRQINSISADYSLLMTLLSGMTLDSPCILGWWEVFLSLLDVQLTVQLRGELFIQKGLFKKHCYFILKMNFNMVENVSKWMVSAADTAGLPLSETNKQKKCYQEQSMGDQHGHTTLHIKRPLL